jgi:hypothetical protein
MSHGNGSERGQSGEGLGLRKILVGLGLVFVIALAVVVGKQMSAEAMAVVVGVVCGVAAGIPTSVLLLVVFSRRDAQRLEEPRQPQRQHNYPPVVVIQGGSSQALPPGQHAGYWPAPPPATSANRQFNVVGGEELFLDEGQM